MAQKTLKISTLIIAISIGVIVITGTSIGIWLGIRNSIKDTEHPDQDWSLKISGNIVGDDFNITIKELLNMPQHEEEYTIRASPPYFVGIFKGVEISYLFNNIIDIDPTATDVTFIAWDGYSLLFSISVISSNDSNILAHSLDGEYYESYPNNGHGYLRLIIPSSGPDDFNGQYCIKSVVEIIFS